MNPKEERIISKVKVINNVDYLKTGLKVLYKNFDYEKGEKQKIILGTTSFIVQSKYLGDGKLKLKFFFLDEFEHALRPTKIPSFHSKDLKDSLTFGILLEEKEIIIKESDLMKIKKELETTNKTLERILKELE